MATSYFYNYSFSVTGSGAAALSLAKDDDLYIGKDSNIASAAGPGIVGLDQNTVIILGDLFGGTIGTFLGGGHNSITVKETGSITGLHAAVHFLGANNRLVNHGDIIGLGNGVEVGAAGSITNSGQIFAHGDAIVFGGMEGQSGLLANSGVINGLRHAIIAHAADEFVINSGLIVGSISLSAGDDTFVNMDGGHLVGLALLGSGADIYVGSDYRDEVSGGAHNDLVELGGDNDVYNSSTYADGKDNVDGGGGRDTFNASASRWSVEIDLLGSIATGTALGNDIILNFESVIGSALADRIFGDDKSNFLRGEGGADLLVGYNGRDRINGGNNNDAINGNDGRDVLTGGAGADSFIYHSISEPGLYSARDIIRDFTINEDKIDLRQVDADALVAGIQDFHFIGNASFSGSGQELRYQIEESTTIVSGDVNGDRLPEFQIQLSGTIGITADDFAL